MQPSKWSDLKKNERVIVRLASYVNPFKIKSPASVGVSTSFPTSDQDTPWLVHSQKLGADLVLQTPPFWLIRAANLHSFAQGKRFLHVIARLPWTFSSAHNANRELFSTYSTSQQECKILHQHAVRQYTVFSQKYFTGVDWTQKQQKMITKENL